LDTLKVDQSFVRGMETDKDTAEIVAGMTGMAQQLGLHVVAEGIENEDQLALLRSLRCESAQGFLFAKPLNADTAAELLKTGLPSRPQRPRHEVTAFPSRREVPVSGLLAGSRRFAPPRTLLMTAAVLALLTLSGLVVFLATAQRAIILSAISWNTRSERHPMRLAEALRLLPLRRPSNPRPSMFCTCIASGVAEDV
jgi:hypothetical protein